MGRQTEREKEARRKAQEWCEAHPSIFCEKCGRYLGEMEKLPEEKGKVITRFGKVQKYEHQCGWTQENLQEIQNEYEKFLFFQYCDKHGIDPKTGQKINKNLTG